MLETRPELGARRDEAITARLLLKAVDVEKTAAVIYKDAEMPVSMAQDIIWEQNLLNHFIPLMIQRSRRWGIEQIALEGVRALNQVKERLNG
jgi:hypothetical protein